MRVIARKHLNQFAVENTTAAASVRYWLKIALAAKWKNGQDVLISFPTAKVIDNERIRFKLGGNKYRMICSVNFRAEVVYIKFLGTHQEYDAVDAKTVRMF